MGPPFHPHRDDPEPETGPNQTDGPMVGREVGKSEYGTPKQGKGGEDCLGKC